MALAGEPRPRLGPPVFCGAHRSSRVPGDVWAAWPSRHALLLRLRHQQAAGGPALFWHQDWWGWQHPISREDRIAQVALFLYMTDTTRENGCLSLIPGSHRRPHPLHDLVDAHDPTLAEVRNPDDAAFASHPDEVDVPVTAGDVVVVDARLIHGAHPNRSDKERTTSRSGGTPTMRAAGVAPGPHLANLRAEGIGYGHCRRPHAPTRHLARAPSQPGSSLPRHRSGPRCA